MELTKYTHACVRLDGLLVDFGVWAEDAALAGAEAVLITHEHADHVDEDRLRDLGLPIFAPADAQLDVEFTAVRSGQEFTAAGKRIRAVGGRHALTHAGMPDCANLGYVIDDRVYHPGDSLSLPEQSVETLLVPVGGPWFRMSEALDFVNAVGADRAVPIHDALYAERGLPTIDSWFQRYTKGYTRLALGETA